MTLRSFVPLALILFTSSIWLYRGRLRVLTPPEKIIEQLFPGQSDNLEQFIGDTDIDVLAKDMEFWVSFGGWAGFLRKRANAKAFVHLCQSVTFSDDVFQEDVEYMTRRASLIAIQGSLAIPEAMVRLLFPGIPHSCAKAAAQFYCEMERRVTIICGNELIEQLQSKLVNSAT
jgi:hypothetical protein